MMISEHVRTHGHVMVFPDESMTMTKSHRCELAITHLPPPSEIPESGTGVVS